MRRYICSRGKTSKKNFFLQENPGSHSLILPGFPEVSLELRDIGTVAHPAIDDRGQGMLFPCQHVLVSFKSARALTTARDHFNSSSTNNLLKSLSFAPAFAFDTIKQEVSGE